MADRAPSVVRWRPALHRAWVRTSVHLAMTLSAFLAGDLPALDRLAAALAGLGDARRRGLPD